ncbi:MAG: hypothetical protein LBM78_03085 [Clostridiales bacterium]|jgi:hypothetical protein|nr:hypothetical protein [Clostridiales bacterium]
MQELLTFLKANRAPFEWAAIGLAVLVAALFALWLRRGKKAAARAGAAAARPPTSGEYTYCRTFRADDETGSV